MSKPKNPIGIPALVGAHIRDLRLAKRFSLKTFHKAGGPTQSTMSAIENGKNGFEVKTLIQIARTLGVLPAELLPNALFEALKWGAIVDEPPTPPKPKKPA